MAAPPDRDLADVGFQHTYLGLDVDVVDERKQDLVIAGLFARTQGKSGHHTVAKGARISVRSRFKRARSKSARATETPLRAAAISTRNFPSLSACESRLISRARRSSRVILPLFSSQFQVGELVCAFRELAPTTAVSTSASSMVRRLSACR